MINLLAVNFARFVVCFFLFCIFCMSMYIAGVALHDPDTCWLLALGRYIFDHQKLPLSDPYSFTSLLSDGQPFVMYQWLSELIFYLSYKIGKLNGVLFLTAVILVNAFISLPLRTCMRVGASMLSALLLVSLSVLTAAWHFLARPEIFSYLFLSFWLGLIWAMHENAQRKMNYSLYDDGEKADIKPATEFPALPKSNPGRVNCAGIATPAIVAIPWKTALIMAGTMLLWCNLHSAFVIGLLILGLYVFSQLITCLIFAKACRLMFTTGLLALMISTAVTLVNPKGIGLWSYLPRLFFSDINKYIVEVQPLSWQECLSAAFCPFICFSTLAVSLAICAWLIICRKSRQSEEKDNWSRGIVGNYTVFATVLLAVAVVSGFLCRRLIPFDAIILATVSASFCAVCKVVPISLPLTHNRDGVTTKHSLSNLFGFFSRAELETRRVFRPEGFWWHSLVFALILLGVHLTVSKITSPTLPHRSLAFQTPFSAIEYLKMHSQSGRVFSDPQYSDMMIWYLHPVPPLFIDTRFDMYGSQIMADYDTINECRGNWRQVFERYDFSWVFIRRQAKLSQSLIQDLNWQKLYSDEDAIILRRPPT